jgi:toxin CptA
LITHNAPPVVYPLGRSRFQGWLLLGLWLAGVLLVLFWFHLARQPDWRMALVVAAVCGAGALAWVGWKKVPSGRLAWDGEVWHWESQAYQAGVAGYELSVIADFQHMLLLRLQNPARAGLWLWAERRVLPERWLDLRRAVYSPHKPAGSSRSLDGMPAEPLPAVAVSGHEFPVDATRIKP